MKPSVTNLRTLLLLANHQGKSPAMEYNALPSHYHQRRKDKFSPNSALASTLTAQTHRRHELPSPRTVSLQTSWPSQTRRFSYKFTQILSLLLKFSWNENSFGFFMCTCYTVYCLQPPASNRATDGIEDILCKIYSHCIDWEHWLRLIVVDSSVRLEKGL